MYEESNRLPTQLVPFVWVAVGGVGFADLGHAPVALLCSFLVTFIGWRFAHLLSSGAVGFLAIGSFWVGVLGAFNLLGDIAPWAPGPWSMTWLTALVLAAAPMFVRWTLDAYLWMVLLGAVTLLLAFADATGGTAEQGTGASLLLAAGIGNLLLHRRALEPGFRGLLLLCQVLVLAIPLVEPARALTLWELAFCVLVLAVAWSAVQAGLRNVGDMRRLHERVPQPLALLDGAGRVRFMNRVAREVAGMGDEGIGMHCHELFHRDGPERAQCPVCTAIAEGRAVEGYELSAGEPARVQLVSVTPLDGGDSLLYVARDVTAQRQSERALRQSEAAWRALVEGAADAIVVLDRNGLIVEANRRMGELTGYERAALLHTAVADLCPREELGRLQEALRRLDQGLPAITDLWLRHRYGSRVPVEMAAAPVEFPAGGVYLGILREVSGRVRAASALRASEARWRAIFDNAGLGIEIRDPVGRIVETNRALQLMLDYEPEELTGRYWSELVYPADIPGALEYETLLRRARGGPVHVEQRYVRKDGGVLWSEVVLTTVEEANGSTRFIIALVTDVTAARLADEQRRLHEAQLHEARQRAEEASAAKTRFLATASHDLRQPIQAVHLLVHLLARDSLPATSAALVERIRGTVEGLGGMLDSLLDVSKLDAGLIQPDIRDVELATLFNQLADEFRPIAAKKGLALRVVRTRVRVRSDRNLLSRILRNLLANAIRYTGRGTVLLGLRRRRGEVGIQVCDTGPGIDRGQVALIFREFHQVGNAARDRREGLGLGLAIVERLSTLLDHRVEVESTVGRGSVFKVFVPLAIGAPVAAVPRLPVGATVAAGTYVLVVEDDVDIREGLEMLLTSIGYEVSVAAGLDDALASFAPEEPPALILADYRLGEVTGIEVIEAVRQVAGAEIPALLLTGDTGVVQSARSKLRVLRKPVASDVLEAMVAEVLREARASTQPRRVVTRI